MAKVSLNCHICHESSLVSKCYCSSGVFSRVPSAVEKRKPCLWSFPKQPRHLFCTNSYLEFLFPRLLISMDQDLVSEPGHLQGIWGYFSLISVVPARVTVVTFLLRNYNSSGVCLASSVHFSPEDTQLLAFSDYCVCVYDWPVFLFLVQDGTDRNNGLRFLLWAAVVWGSFQMSPYLVLIIALCDSCDYVISCVGVVFLHGYLYSFFDSSTPAKYTDHVHPQLSPHTSSLYPCVPLLVHAFMSSSSSSFASSSSSLLSPPFRLVLPVRMLPICSDHVTALLPVLKITFVW